MAELPTAVASLQTARELLNSERGGISIVGRTLSASELDRLLALATALSHIDSAIRVLEAG